MDNHLNPATVLPPFESPPSADIGVMPGFATDPTAHRAYKIWFFHRTYIIIGSFPAYSF